MPSFNIVKKSKPSESFRVASVMGKFDLNSNKIEETFVGNIELPKKWQVGLIVGASGTGKTTIAKELFPKSYITNFKYKAESILDDMPKDKSIDEIVKTFNAVGFSSPPSWLKSYSVLNNGQKMRVDLANALLNKKCFGLRIASKIAYNEGWLAEHCLILRIISPTGEIKHILGAFPSSCGKTNLAMIDPNEELKKLGWKFETIGDDIAWIYPKNGSLYAFNPENGFFGVSNGTNEKTNNNAIKMLEKDCIFTNCAVYFNDDNKLDVWWEGKTKEPPNKFLNWKEEENILPASHPNARYTCPITNCPILSKDYEKMVKIDAIMFGGRRSDTIPLISKAENIHKGIFYGASLSSEQTSANSEAVIGNIRFDPMAMKPFIGYNINDYFKHWIDVIEKLENPPDFYLVNWFRKENNKFLWKGFNENSLILKWIFKNSNYRNHKSSFGFHPPKEKLNLTTEEWNKLFYTDNEKKKIHKNNIKEFFNELKNVPDKLYDVINTI